MCARFFCELGGFLNFVRFLPDMVTPTFFLWEITQKFFFLAYGFHILATQKNNFHGPGGSQWGPGGLLAHFRAKKGYFRPIFHKIQGFKLIKDLFILQNNKEAHKNLLNESLTHKTVKRGSKSFKNCNFRQKNGFFF